MTKGIVFGTISLFLADAGLDFSAGILYAMAIQELVTYVQLGGPDAT